MKLCFLRPYRNNSLMSSYKLIHVVCFILLEERYVPRAALIDLEPGPLDAIKGGPSGGLYSSDNYVYGK